MLVDQFGNAIKSPATRGATRGVLVRGRYDAAATTDDNRRHWASADSLSAVSANSSAIRRTLRNRSRYEVANNCYARGILNTVAAYTVGIGPTLQLTYRGEQQTDPQQLINLRAAAQRVEQLWANWAYARRITQKLTTATLAVDQDGECFGVLQTARPNMNTPVSLDVRLYECDWFDDPVGDWRLQDTGVRLDAAGEPEEYSMLNNHPGDATTLADLTARWVPADQVLHMFRRERPGQLRGIPRTTPALPLFSQLRRFTLATLTAAETAADFAAIMTNGETDPDDIQQAEEWDRIEIERGAMITTPFGSSITQLKAEHPNATYDEFVRAILREIARCLSVPAVIALGDASNYNYASGRLDLQSFTRQMGVDRSQVLENEFLDRLWEAWLDEALLIDGFLPELFRRTAGEWEFGWRWTEPEHVDRAKEATGQQTELANNTTTLAREYARRGLDWETELRQRAREVALVRELDLMPEPPASPTPSDQTSQADAEEQTANA
jgi:lambda family phage portal protein